LSDSKNIKHHFGVPLFAALTDLNSDCPSVKAGLSLTYLVDIPPQQFLYISSLARRLRACTVEFKSIRQSRVTEGT
jgi:hypothetical protein